MNWQRVEGNWKELTGNVKRQWDMLVERQLGLWAGKRDRPKPVARRQAGIEKPNHSNQGNQS